MKLLVDECLAKSTILILKKSGLNLLFVEKELKPGISDQIIFDYALNIKYQ